MTDHSIVEQPFKIPFVAAVVLTTNSQKPEVTQEILKRVGIAAQSHLEVGNWRELKLVLRFLGCLQSLFEGEGVFPLLEDLFERAVALQTASSEDVSSPPLFRSVDRLTRICRAWAWRSSKLFC